MIPPAALQNWLPTAVITSLLALFWYGVKKDRKERDEYVNSRLDIQRADIEKKLDEAKHELITRLERLKAEKTLQEHIMPISKCVSSIENSLEVLHKRQLELTNWLREKVGNERPT
jgi:hypothetical protein